MKKLLIVLGLVCLSVAIVACNGPQSQVVTGVVLTVDQPSAGQVDGFTLRTSAGQVMTFTVGVVDQDEGAFPPQHLTEHMQTAEPVKVTYKVQDGKNVATKLQDADGEPAGSQDPGHSHDAGDSHEPDHSHAAGESHEPGDSHEPDHTGVPSLAP